MPKKRTRRRHTSADKAALLQRHHVEKVPVSEICNEVKLQPSLFYDWQRQLFANAATVFDAAKPGVPSREKELEAENARLREKLAKKDEVIAEVTEEFVKLKKALGEP
jgi:transposase-like protein